MAIREVRSECDSMFGPHVIIDGVSVLMPSVEAADLLGSSKTLQESLTGLLTEYESRIPQEERCSCNAHTKCWYCVSRDILERIEIPF